ncbi:MAG: DUF362 domain-containing protein [Deltaproteobacteria bacterium]|nr:DUF362 domain-containing protein [Deltaproteobacteria bacterium]
MKEMVDYRVIVSKGEDPYLTTQEALTRFSPSRVKGKRVLIKPNAARLALPGEGITTHPMVIAAIIDYLREKGALEILIGESCIFGVDAEEAFLKTGMREIAKKRGVLLLDLDRLEPMELNIPQGRLLKRIRVSSILRSVDLIISAPVMKTHMHTQVTLSIKNMKGLLWKREKARLHHLVGDPKTTEGDKELDVAISEMGTVLFPHLAVIDGTVGLEGMGPAYGQAKKVGLVVVSDHALACDRVASELMGFPPDRVPHLKRLSGKGLEKVSVDPADYLKWRDPFEPSPSQLSIPYPDVAVYDEGSCSACLSTLLVFLQNYYDQLDDYRLGDKRVHIGIGKHLDDCPQGTLLIGNCTSGLKKRGTFVRGCPPIASQIMGVLTKKKKGVLKRFRES